MRTAWIPFLCFCNLLIAQNLDEPPQRATGKRLEVPYTLAVETPHVNWARPLPGGPIRLLAVPSVQEGRTLVELAQRLSLDLTTVSIDPQANINQWTMSLGPDYNTRADRHDLGKIYKYLEEELTSAKHFDAILLPLAHGWERLTPASREALLRRVREGCGLVLIRPFASEITPLVPAVPVALDPDPAIPVEPATEVSPWRRTADDYITRAIPVEAFPFRYLENYVYRAAPGAKVLIETASGHPLMAERDYGKGRVVAFAYRNTGIAWRMPAIAAGFVSDLDWEYFYALLCRALMYAARREPVSEPDWNSANVVWRLKDADGRLNREGEGPRPAFSGLEPGRHFLELQSGIDWRISTVDVPQPDKIEDLRATPAVVGEGDTIEVSWRANRAARIELVDGWERIIARGVGSGNLRLKAGRPLTPAGFVRATVGTAVEKIPIQFRAGDRSWKDYEVTLPSLGPAAYYPWIRTLDEQLHRIGITAVSGAVRNFKLIADAHTPGFGLAWFSPERLEYVRRKGEFARTGDTKYLQRFVSFESPEFEAGLRRAVNSLRDVIPLRPFAYFMVDEASITAYADPCDLDWSPVALSAFRVWLQKEYGTLEALNTNWNAHFSSWNDVLPMTTEQAQKHGNYAPWADHREFMDHEYAEAYARAGRMIHDLDPEARVAVSGTQIPSPHDGGDWYRLDQVIDYLQPYSNGNQDQMHPFFKPGILLTGYAGYGDYGPRLQYTLWQRLFNGQAGASIWWQYTLLNPDLTLSPQGETFQETFSRLQGGIGRIFLNSKVHTDGVAIHFSMASIRGAWITDGKIRAGWVGGAADSKNFRELEARRNAWVKSLNEQHVQFRFLATPEIEAGALANIKVLILPYSIAITDKEAQEIDRFLERGGIVYADEQTGRMDGHCRWRKAQLWSTPPRGMIRGGPVTLGIKRPIEVPGEFLVTDRDFGSSRLIGMLSRKDSTVHLPPAQRPRYDLFRGGPAADEIVTGPGKPLLLLERATRIAKLEMDPSLHIRLTDEAGAPVDRSVVRVEVFDPTGKPVRYYSGNATIVDGRADFEVPFALNDAPGPWRIVVRDVISGLTAEQIIRRAAE